MPNLELLKQTLRRVRWQARHTMTAVRLGKRNLDRSPILFGNSFPKSGTHLLAQVLMAFPKIGLAVDPGQSPVLTFERSTGKARPSAEILRDLERYRPGDIGFGHIIATPEILSGWKHAQTLHLFMIRDLRDVVLSHALYIGDKATHNYHHAYYQGLSSDAERIKTSILGRSDVPEIMPNIGARFELYRGWMECDWVHILRFEDFITNREEALKKLLEISLRHGFQLHTSEEKALLLLNQAIDPAHSFTFRSGKTGEWKQHFTDEHKRLFKEVAGDVLIQLGYEKDRNW